MKEVSVKSAFDKFKPESCVFVISVDEKNKPSGMIAGWNMKCSVNPPLIAVALWKKGYTHKLVRKSKEFVVAVPNKKLQKALEIFGSRHGDKIDKFAETKIEVLQAKFLKSPILKDATINFECKLYKEINSGDHIIFIGEVLNSHIDKSQKVLLNMGKINGKREFQEF